MQTREPPSTIESVTTACDDPEVSTFPECAVEHCSFQAVASQSLKPPDSPYAWPTEVVLCEIHRQQLSDPATEWILLNESTGRRLLVGPMLAELNEYIVVEPRNRMLMHKASRDFSHEEHDGCHLPLRVRLRGSDEEGILTLVIPYDYLDETASFFRGLAPTRVEERDVGAKGPSDDVES